MCLFPEKMRKEREPAYGEGFYTAKGREGAAGTGFTIRFKVNPEAREGKDFISTNFNFICYKKQILPLR